MRKLTLSLLCAALSAACGPPGQDPDGGSPDGGARPCANACACAERGPPDYRGETAGTPSASSSAEQTEGLTRANRWRTASGLAPIHANAQVEDAALRHAQFMASNASTCWPGAHSQVNNAGCQNFTGANPGARLVTSGYAWSAYGEVIDWADTPTRAVDEWIWTVYHRKPFMRWEYVHMGYGRAQGPYNGRTAWHNVVDFASPRSGERPTQPTSGFAVFPLPGQTDVPVGFRGDLEGPTPPAPGTLGAWPRGLSSGQVVSAHFVNAMFEVSEHLFYRSEPGGTRCEPVEHTFISRANDRNLMTSHDVFLYANEALQPMTEYVTHLRGTVNGQPFDRTWAFTTR
ncbi:MAG: CAP domain-containing protein [Deltaproteobacteria bacterium]|nr:CAP domain-containing protein [Deltaproteobacteria bacterium]